MVRSFMVAAAAAAAVTTCLSVIQVALGTKPNCLSPEFSNRGSSVFGWQNGASSRCMPVTWPFATTQAQFPDSASLNGASIQDSRCYDTSCTPSGQLQLSILGNKVDCPSGQTVDLATALPGVFTQGSIGPCPDNAAACGSLACGESCTGDGVCVAGKCYCSLMYTGPGCRTRIVPGRIKASSSAYVQPPDQRVKLPGGAQGPVVAGATDGPIVSEASPGDTSDTSDTGYTGGYDEVPSQGDISSEEEVPSPPSSETEVPTQAGDTPAGGFTTPKQPVTNTPAGTSNTEDTTVMVSRVPGRFIRDTYLSSAVTNYNVPFLPCLEAVHVAAVHVP
jgi:hypothetical protein